MALDPVKEVTGLESGASLLDVLKSQFIAFEQKNIYAFGTCADVRNRDLTGRTTIMAGDRFFALDTDDLSADDGTEDTATIIDSAGNHFVDIEFLTPGEVAALAEDNIFTGINTFNANYIDIKSGGPALWLTETDASGYYTGTAQSGSGTTITLAAGASSITNDSKIVGQVIEITSGTGVGSKGIASAYNGTTKDVTVASWTGTAPANGSGYSVGATYLWYNRFIRDGGIFYGEWWEPSNPLSPGSTPFADQDEWIRVNRFIHTIGFNYSVFGSGYRTFRLGANNPWDHDGVDAGFPTQTAQDLEIVALNAATYVNIPVIKFKANNASPWMESPIGVHLGIGTGAQPGCAGDFSTNTGALPAVVTSTIVRAAAADGSAAVILAECFSNSSAVAGGLFVGRTARGTAGSPSALQSGDQITGLIGRGYGATGYSSAGRGGILLTAAENWTDSAQGTQVDLSTVTNGATTRTDRFRVQNDGHLVPRADQTYDVGKTGAILRAIYTSQIAFPASQNASADANTLDDYEEGTFSPALTLGGGNTGITYTTQVGTYTKIGNVVYYELQILLSSKGSSTGQAAITGLPFTAAASPALVPAVLQGNTFSSISGSIAALVAGGTTTISTIAFFGTGTSTNVNDTHLNNTSNIRISGHYKV